MFKIINQLIMTKEEQIKIIKHLNDENLELLKSKGNDYGADDDILINFKMVSGAAKALKVNVHTPEGYSLFMMLVKMARLTNLLNNDKQPVNERVSDSFKDLSNYAQLTYLNYLEQSGVVEEVLEEI